MAALDPVKGRQALQRYRVMAWVTGTMLLILCLEMILKYAVRVGPDVVAWIRAHAEERVLVVGNMGDAALTLDLSRVAAAGEVLAATDTHRGRVRLGELRLGPSEGLLARL